VITIEAAFVVRGVESVGLATAGFAVCDGGERRG
jgi:hypothetical protein